MCQATVRLQELEQIKMRQYGNHHLSNKKILKIGSPNRGNKRLKNTVETYIFEVG